MSSKPSATKAELKKRLDKPATDASDKKTVADNLDLSAYEPLFPVQCHPPKTVEIYSLPLSPTTLKETIPLAEFFKRTGKVAWSEVPLVKKGSGYAKSLTSKQLQRSVQPLLLDNNSIAYVDMGPFTYGTFTKVKIPKGTAFLKGGLVLTSDIENCDRYGITHNMTYPSFADGADGSASLVINAKHCGNALSLFQNAPSEETLDHYSFEEKQCKETVAIRNFQSKISVIEGVPVLVFVSIRDILPFELLTIEYTPYPDYLDYWIGQNMTPSLFERGSYNPIPNHLYRYDKVEIVWVNEILSQMAAITPLKMSGFIKIKESLKFMANCVEEFPYLTITTPWQKIIDAYEKASKTTPNPAVVRVECFTLAFTVKFFDRVNELFNPKFAATVGNRPEAWELVEGHPPKLKLKKFALPTQDGFIKHFKNGRALGLEKHLEIIEVQSKDSSKKEFHLYLKDLAGLLEYFNRTFKQQDSVPVVTAAPLPALPAPAPAGPVLSSVAPLAPVSPVLFSQAVASAPVAVVLPVVDECHLFSGNGHALPPRG